MLKFCSQGGMIRRPAGYARRCRRGVGYAEKTCNLTGSSDSLIKSDYWDGRLSAALSPVKFLHYHGTGPVRSAVARVIHKKTAAVFRCMNFQEKIYFGQVFARENFGCFLFSYSVRSERTRLPPVAPANVISNARKSRRGRHLRSAMSPMGDTFRLTWNASCVQLLITNPERALETIPSNYIAINRRNHLIKEINTFAFSQTERNDGNSRIFA